MAHGPPLFLTSADSVLAAGFDAAFLIWCCRSLRRVIDSATLFHAGAASLPIRTSLGARALVAGVVFVSLFLQFHALADVPARLSGEEATFGVYGHALATTGRDINGNPTPLFVNITDPLIPNHSSFTWWQPLLFYLVAGVFRFAPVSEWWLRAPIAFLAVLNVVVMYFVARRWFRSEWFGVLAAAMLALNPAHMILGREAMDYYCPITFCLVWLLCVSTYVDTDNAVLPAAAGLSLGVGLYSYITSWVVMPFYLVLTMLVFHQLKKPVNATISLCGAFLVPVLALVAWLWRYPGMPLETIRNYEVPAGWKLLERANLYWDYFNPSYLFFEGASDWLWSTRRAGVFLLVFAVLIPYGIAVVLRERRSVLNCLLIAGFLAAPAPIVAALPVSPRHATARAILAVPFGILLAVAATQWFIESRHAVRRLLAMVLLCFGLLQFVSFARDYFTNYPARSAFRFDVLDVRSVVAYIIASDRASPVPQVMVSVDVGAPRSMMYRFHLTANNRLDLLSRSKYIDLNTLDGTAVPSGTLLVLKAEHPSVSQLTASGDYEIARVVTDPIEGPIASILRRR